MEIAFEISEAFVHSIVKFLLEERKRRCETGEGGEQIGKVTGRRVRNGETHFENQGRRGQIGEPDFQMINKIAVNNQARLTVIKKKKRASFSALNT